MFDRIIIGLDHCKKNCNNFFQRIDIIILLYSLKIVINIIF